VIVSAIYSKTLEQLEDEYWAEPTFHSHLVIECHRMRKIPLRDLTDENLRMAIGQKMGLQYLLPLAIEQLNENPLASGDLYDSDLLSNIFTLPASVWGERRDLREKLLAIANRFFPMAENHPESEHQTIDPEIRAEYDRFLARPS